MKIEVCSKCPARIIWALTKNNVPQPLDAEMVFGGNIELHDIPGSNKFRSVVVTPDPAIKRYMPHHATCPAWTKTHKAPAAGPDARTPARTGAPSSGTRAATPSPATPTRPAAGPSRPASPLAPVPPAAGPHGPMDPRPNSREDRCFAPDGPLHRFPPAAPRPPELRLELRPPAPPPTEEEMQARQLRAAAELAGHAREHRDRAAYFRRLTEKAIEADIDPAKRPYLAMAEHHAALASGYADLTEDAHADCQDTQDAHRAALEAIRARDEIRALYRQAESRIQQAHKEI